MGPLCNLYSHPGDVAGGLPQCQSHFFLDLSLEKVLMISPGMPKEDVLLVALWIDVVGHLSNDIRVLGTTPARAFLDGAEMIRARLRQLAIQSDAASAVIRVVSAAASAHG